MTVYLIRASNTERHKIGQSNDPDQRLKDLQKASPVSLGMVGYSITFSEEFWQWLFSNKQAHGEWFDLSEADVALFSAMENIDVLWMHTSRTGREIARAMAEALLDYADSSDS